MSKRYNAGKFMNVGAVIGSVNPPVSKKENIFTTDAHISKKVYRNQESSDYGWINELPSTIKREYSKMSNAEKALFWLTGFALLGVAGYASSDTVKKTVDDNAKKVYEKLFSKSGGKSAPIAPVVPAVNATVNPTITPQPKYDYYDEKFKVGIMIEGDQQFKQNVTNLLETFKQVTPDDYNDLIKYAPKKIEISPDIYSWYGGPPNNDYIQIQKGVEKAGGNVDLNKRKAGLPNLVGEFNNAKQFKTGHSPNIIDQEKAKLNYSVKIGVMTQEEADNNLRWIESKLNDGTYFNDIK